MSSCPLASGISILTANLFGGKWQIVFLGYNLVELKCENLPSHQTIQLKILRVVLFIYQLSCNGMVLYIGIIMILNRNSLLMRENLWWKSVSFQFRISVGMCFD